MKPLRILIAAVLLNHCLLAASYGQQSSKKDYLHCAGPILFENKKFNLAWSSHPLAAYYKQEYLAKGETLEKFNTLLTLDAIVSNVQVRDAANVKINELEKRKASDPLAHYQVFEKADEVMIDFIISQNIPGSQEAAIVERNVYRYKYFSPKNGQKGVLLFAVSERAYGNNTEKFLVQLKTNRQLLLNDVGAFAIPGITIGN